MRAWVRFGMKALPDMRATRGKFKQVPGGYVLEKEDVDLPEPEATASFVGSLFVVGVVSLGCQDLLVPEATFSVAQFGLRIDTARVYPVGRRTFLLKDVADAFGVQPGSPAANLLNWYGLISTYYYTYYADGVDVELEVDVSDVLREPERFGLTSPTPTSGAICMRVRWDEQTVVGHEPKDFDGEGILIPDGVGVVFFDALSGKRDVGYDMTMDEATFMSTVASEDEGFAMVPWFFVGVIQGLDGVWAAGRVEEATGGGYMYSYPGRYIWLAKLSDSNEADVVAVFTEGAFVRFFHRDGTPILAFIVPPEKYMDGHYLVIQDGRVVVDDGSDPMLAEDVPAVPHGIYGPYEGDEGTTFFYVYPYYYLGGAFVDGPWLHAGEAQFLVEDFSVASPIIKAIKTGEVGKEAVEPRSEGEITVASAEASKERRKVKKKYRVVYKDGVVKFERA